MSKRTLVKSVITITDTAVNRIKYLINKNNDPNIIGVHLSTRLRGCNGNSYVMDYTKDKLLTDEHVHCKGINVYIDKKALFKVIGTKMDFEKIKFPLNLFLQIQMLKEPADVVKVFIFSPS